MEREKSSRVRANAGSASRTAVVISVAGRHTVAGAGREMTTCAVAHRAHPE